MHRLYLVTFFRKSCHLRCNLETCGGARGRISFANWISKATRAQAHAREPTPTHKHAHAHRHIYAHTKYVIPFSFPLQQYFRERASLLHYTYIVCLVYIQMLYALVF